jgi:hypothetical protein
MKILSIANSQNCTRLTLGIEQRYSIFNAFLRGFQII